MFNKDFYPTPKPIIRKMLKPYKGKRQSGGFHSYEYDGYNTHDLMILEPSAGKGDILDFIRDNTSNKKVYCIEQDPELQSILKEKGYQLLGEDFLNYKGDLIFDLIIMNPPFSNGDEHLLHAWNTLIEGDIVCLLNAQTLDNTHTKTRQLLKTIIDEHGTTESLGDCFNRGEVERKTAVGVVLVRLTKEDNGERFQFFENKTRETFHDLDEDVIGDPVARHDVLGNMVLQYEKCKEIFIEYMNLDKRLHFYMEPLLSYMVGGDFLKDSLGAEKSKDGYNSFVNGLRRNAWSTVFNKTKLSNYMTSKVAQDFESYARDQGSMSFTVENIEKLFETLFMNQKVILEQCLLQVFDRMTSYDVKNKIHVEGWKTNDAYKVNQKVIMPWFIKFDTWRDNGSGNYDTSYSYRSDLDDIDKALCLLTGEKFGNIQDTYNTLDRRFRELGSIFKGDKYDNTAQSHFFDLKFWKKGTLHMAFRDTRVWEQFNITAAKGKNWLPDNYEEDKPKAEKPVSKATPSVTPVPEVSDNGQLMLAM